MVRVRDTAWTPAERTRPDPDLPERADALAELMHGRRTVVLTGAGIALFGVYSIARARFARM